MSPAGTSATFSESRTHAHGPLIEGTFTMSVGSTPIMLWDSVSRSYSNEKIPHNVTSWELSNAFRQIPGFEKVDVYRTGDPDYGSKWFISYFEYSGNVDDIALTFNGITGGKAGTSPRMTSTETRPYSTNVIFNPVS